MSAEPWRLINSGPCEASYNMALDEAIARETMQSERPPTLRLYSWDRPSVTLGRFQRAAEVNTEFCADRNIPFVRRPTGGRAILHGEELTYSFSACTSSGPFQGDILSSYATLSAAFFRGFELSGLNVQATGRRRKPRSAHASGGAAKNPLCFSSASYGELTVDGKKIIGSAQRRWKGGMLQQGSIPFEIQRQDTASVFGATHGAGELTGLREFIPEVTYESLKDALVSGFQQALGISLEEARPAKREEDSARQLLEKKYAGRGWNYQK